MTPRLMMTRGASWKIISRTTEACPVLPTRISNHYFRGPMRDPVPSLFAATNWLRFRMLLSLKDELKGK